jgi:hypothetical protein
MDELFPPNHKKGRIITSTSTVPNVADIASEEKDCISLSEKSDQEEQDENPAGSEEEEVDMDKFSQNQYL